ncbi:Crp/Fnr family transcriptional regulator [Flavihumibacter rivuli]|uniref:Crp/Fnr family transcriptional regulator n=1 Tax=Flavihumibacter rivuli TaxID=2838156 RepID=UPI001BDE51A9|nr:Crp/Fnr family transcriptional regulator [Flavihumibacter rivuli]ULQ57312.1 Crp/Fnr family transcriptional regulator [Flavihumibacter rivuli]
MPEEVLSYVRRFVDLDPAEAKLFTRQVQVMTCSARQVLTGMGEVENHIYFIRKGIVRKYFTKGKEEVTVQLCSKGDLTSSIASFITGKPSDYVLETLEPSALVFITRSGLDQLYSCGVNFEKMGRMIFLEAMLAKERWDMERMLHSPLERFQSFNQKHPHLMQQVPQKYLASLLDIEPETFSRYKARLAGHAAAKNHKKNAQ